MSNNAEQMQLAEVLAAALRNSSVPSEQRTEFSRKLVTSYLALIRQPNPLAFSASQLEPMRAMLRQGLEIEMLIAALEQLGIAAKVVLKERQATISFATIIAKMVAAEANLQVVG